MSLLRPESPSRAVDSLLVGLLFIFLDLRVSGGFDLAPDVIGLVMLASGITVLSAHLGTAANAALGQGAWTLGWVAAGLAGVLFLVDALRLVGAERAVTDLLMPVRYPFLLSEAVTLLAVAAAAAFLQAHAGRAGALPGTVNLLKAGWIIAAATAALTALYVLGVVPTDPLLLRIAGLAAGITTGLGVSRCRNESVL